MTSPPMARWPCPGGWCGRRRPERSAPSRPATSSDGTRPEPASWRTTTGAPAARSATRCGRRNENRTGLAQIARLGPTLWLKIPIRALKLAHNLGQPCTIFVSSPFGLARLSLLRPLASALPTRSLLSAPSHAQIGCSIRGLTMQVGCRR